MIIDDVLGEPMVSRIGTTWQIADADAVIAVPKETFRHEVVLGRRCLRLTGDVLLTDHGGALQMVLDLRRGGGRALDGSDFLGLRVTVWGNGKIYSARLRTRDCREAWQDYRTYFDAGDSWHDVYLPFDEFEGHRLKAELDTTGLTRLALVAVGRGFKADLAVAGVTLYR